MEIQAGKVTVQYHSATIYPWTEQARRYTLNFSSVESANKYVSECLGKPLTGPVLEDIAKQGSITAIQYSANQETGEMYIIELDRR